MILGIHAPEFAFEKDPKNVQKAVTDAGLQYPITLDNDYKTWNAYENRYWPAKYFIDREGKLRHSHFGEGEYTESEQVIQYLLGTTGPTTTVNPVVSSKMNTTKETYLGYSRADSIVNSAYGLGTKIYTPGPIKSGEVTLGGSWNTKNERIE